MSPTQHAPHSPTVTVGTAKVAVRLAVWVGYTYALPTARLLLLLQQLWNGHLQQLNPV